MVSLCPVLLGLISTVGGEVLCPRARGLLYQHPVTNFLPDVKHLLDPPPDCVGCGDMTGLLQYYFRLLFLPWVTLGGYACATGLFPEVYVATY